MYSKFKINRISINENNLTIITNILIYLTKINKYR